MAQMSKIEKSFSESFAEKKHSISLVNRSEMSLSGVNDVSEFFGQSGYAENEYGRTLYKR